MSAPTVLVTGATGFLGSALTRELVRRGYRVRALHRIDSALNEIEELPVELVQGDLFDPASLSRATRGAEVIVHCAGLVGDWRATARMTASHVEGTRNMVLAALRQRVARFIHVSSVAALGAPRAGSIDETRGMTESHSWNLEPEIWPYGYAKHRAELEVWAATAAGLDARIALPAYILGPGESRRPGGGVVGRAVARGLPPLAPTGGLNVVHIQDVVAGLLAVMEHGARGRRYLLVGHNLSLGDFLGALAAEADGRPPRWEIPPGPLRAAGAAAARLRSYLPGLPARLPMLALAGRRFFYDDRRTRAQLPLDPPRHYREAISAAVEWIRAGSDRARRNSP